MAELALPPSEGGLVVCRLAYSEDGWLVAADRVAHVLGVEVRHSVKLKRASPPLHRHTGFGSWRSVADSDIGRLVQGVEALGVRFLLRRSAESSESLCATDDKRARHLEAVMTVSGRWFRGGHDVADPWRASAGSRSWPRQLGGDGRAARPLLTTVDPNLAELRQWFTVAAPVSSMQSVPKSGAYLGGLGLRTLWSEASADRGQA